MPEHRIESVLETCLYVEDLQATERFYSEILCLEQFSREEGKFVFYRVGEGMLLIFDPEASSDGAHDLPNHGANGVQHIAFAVDEDSLDDWKDYLSSKAIEIELDHLWPHGRRSLYFRDPSGHSLELASKGLWH